MQEYLLLIRTQGAAFDELSPEQQQQHIQKIHQYISGLMEQGKLKSAQPLEQHGKIISRSQGGMKDGPFNETKEVIAGYFLILAENLEEAMEIARANPMLDDTEGTRIEVRPVKTLPGIN